MFDFACRHIQQTLKEFDPEQGGSVQFEKNFNSLFESFSKNQLLQNLSSDEKLVQFKMMVKAVQMDTFEQVCWARFQYVLELRMLELKRDASYEEDVEDFS